MAKQSKVLAKKAKMNFNTQGFIDLRHQRKVREFLLKKAQEIQKEAGAGHEKSPEELGYIVTNLLAEDPRAAVSVMATGHARNHNAKYRALLKALSKALES